MHKPYTKLYILFFEHESCEGSKCAVSCGDVSRFTSKIFHTQGGFSVLTLLAFGNEMYYICIEIWEEPQLPPFFVPFPLKTGFWLRLSDTLGAPLGNPRCASRKNYAPSRQNWEGESVSEG